MARFLLNPALDQSKRRDDRREAGQAPVITGSSLFI
jgi:hypothetical protein